MSNWVTTKLGNIATIITGPFGSQLHQSDYVSEEDADRLKKYKTGKLV